MRYIDLPYKHKKENGYLLFSSTFERLLEKQQFFESCGLRVEKVPFYTDDTKLNALAMFPPKIQEKMITQMKTFAVWKMTVTDLPEETEILQGESSSNNLLQQYTLYNKTLKIVMEGRLDTLNAPAFLKLYEDMGGHGRERKHKERRAGNSRT